MDEQSIREAMAEGLSAVCATCELYWKARELGRPSGCMAPADSCGSVLVGRAFPLYRGPITDLSRWCFMCGCEAAFGVRAASMTRSLGVCEPHLAQIKEWVPVEGSRPLILISNQNVIAVERLVRPKILTLGSLLRGLQNHHEG